MSPLLTRRIIAVVAYVVMIALNAMATLLPINGQTTAEVSAKYDTLFAPNGYTFAIWGIIYLLLAIYSVYQLVRDNAMIRSITPWYIASSAINAVWIIFWHYEIIWLALVLIVGLLFTLIKINGVTAKQRNDWPTTIAIRLPFAVYFGWVTVATVANTSALLVKWGWRGGTLMSEAGWTSLTLVVAAAIGIAATLKNSSLGYGLVLVWAFNGILSRHLDPTGWDGAYSGVISTLRILLPILIVVCVVAAFRWFRQPVEPEPTTSLKAAASQS